MTTDAPPIRIESPPLRVVNGVVLVGQTRVPMDTIIGSFLDGMTAEAIAESFNTVSLAEVYATIAYYLQHRDEVDEYMHQRQSASDALRDETRSDPEYRNRIQSLLERARAKGLRP